MHAVHGRILHVDLTRERFDIVRPEDGFYRELLGGKGIGTRLLLDHVPAGADPLGPENRIIFATGPFCGTLIWGGSRYGVYTKSPLTGGYLESYSGGKTPEAVDAAGFDAVCISGKASRPTVLSVHPDGCAFLDGSPLWGLDNMEAEERAVAGFGVGEFRKRGAVVIGPGGENLSRFAIVSNDRWRCAGRGGAGAVMGSKLLKGIVFQGDRKRQPADPAGVREYARKFAEAGKENPGTKAYRAQGTTMMVAIMNLAGAFPARYWSQGTCDHWEQISGDHYHQTHEITPRACAKCFMACGRKSRLTSGRHKGLELEGPEYETLYAFGGLCMITEIEEIVYLNHLCDRMGLDTISAGNLCAMVMEGVEQGRIDWPYRYGDADGCARLIEDMALGRGHGAILSKGIVSASRELGLEDLAIHVKGMEPPGYDPRVLKGVGLGYGVSDRGACHLRATFYKPELSGMIDRDTVEGKAELFVEFENRLTLFDALILCRFYRDMYTWEELETAVELVTGLGMSAAELDRIGQRVTDLAREFNVREGFTARDDMLPERFHTQPLPSGHTLNKGDYMRMMRDYYAIKGWDTEDLE